MQLLLLFLHSTSSSSSTNPFSAPPDEPNPFLAVLLVAVVVESSSTIILPATPWASSLLLLLLLFSVFTVVEPFREEFTWFVWLVWLWLWLWLFVVVVVDVWLWLLFVVAVVVAAVVGLDNKIELSEWCVLFWWWDVVAWLIISMNCLTLSANSRFALRSSIPGNSWYVCSIASLKRPFKTDFWISLLFFFF